VSNDIIPLSFFRIEGRIYGKISSLSQKLSLNLSYSITIIIMINEKNILISDDDVVETSLNKKWLEAEQEKKKASI
jgi:hypothetical protein